jgi:Bacterial protein of unknown function (DUF899)
LARTKERIADAAEALAARCLAGRQSSISSTDNRHEYPQAVLREMLAMSLIAARSLNAESPRNESDEMPEHKIGTREEWQATRNELAKLEAEQADRNEKIKEKRLALPWVRVEKEYEFDTENGKKTLTELFDGRSPRTGILAACSRLSSSRERLSTGTAASPLPREARSARARHLS